MKNVTIYSRGTALAVVLFAALSILVTAGTAVAQSDPYGGGEPVVNPTVIVDEDEGTAGEEPEVLGETISDVPGEAPEAPEVRSETAPEVQGGALPFTGGDLVLFIGIGAVAIAAGAWMWKRGSSNA